MNECLIALGGNIDVSEQIFADAVVQLQGQGFVDIRMSRIIATRPVGPLAGQEFLNAAAVARTRLDPVETLKKLHGVESYFRRSRTIHWGPRTLDLDLILHGSCVANSPQIVLPHPAMWYRRFVLEPAVDVAAHMVHPIFGETVSQLFQRLNSDSLHLEICESDQAGHQFILNDILSGIGGSHPKVCWSVQTPGRPIAVDAFARVLVQRGEQLQSSQPFNREVREILVAGPSVTQVQSQIEHVILAMMG